MEKKTERSDADRLNELSILAGAVVDKYVRMAVEAATMTQCDIANEIVELARGIGFKEDMPHEFFDGVVDACVQRVHCTFDDYVKEIAIVVAQRITKAEQQKKSR